MIPMTIPDSVRTLERDLRSLFGDRLQSLSMYAGHADERVVHTMAVVDALGGGDLRACAARVGSWHAAGLATPLLVAAHEFERSLDVFPLEFGGIIANHVVVSGADPFEKLTVDPADVRRACEVQARGHLLHLREGFLETRGNSDALALLLVESAPAFAALLASVARLETEIGSDPAAAGRHVERMLGVSPGSIAAIVALAGVHEIPAADAERLFPPYLDASERLVQYVDGWSAR